MKAEQLIKTRFFLPSAQSKKILLSLELCKQLKEKQPKSSPQKVMSKEQVGLTIGAKLKNSGSGNIYKADKHSLL